MIKREFPSEEERVRSLVVPALQHLIKLESYFRINGVERISHHLEAALVEAESITQVPRAPADGNGDAPSSSDQDQSRCTSGSKQETHGRAALG